MAGSKIDSAGSLSRWLQSISGSGWANIQRPVREGFEAMVSTADALVMESTTSREHLKSLEARIVGIEDMFSQRLESNARRTGEEIEALRSTVGATPGLHQVQSIASSTCKGVESAFTEKIRKLEDSLEEVRAVAKEAVEVVRQASTGKAALADPQAFYPRAEAATRADLVQLKNQINQKPDREALENTLSTKVSWSDLERLLREKADASVVVELGASSASTAAALDRIELGLAGTVGVEEVRALIEKQTEGVQSIRPDLERLLVMRAKEEREAAERDCELPELVVCILREFRDGSNADEDSSSLPSLAQIQAEITSSGKSILRTVEEQLLRLNRAQQQDLLVQEDRLHLELKGSTGRLCGRIEGLERALEQAKSEFVVPLNSKVSKSENSEEIQGKAEAISLETIMAPIPSKDGDTDYREALAKTLHALSALSTDIGGVRAELKEGMEKLSIRLVKKADNDNVDALKTKVIGSQTNGLLVDTCVSPASPASPDDSALGFAQAKILVSTSGGQSPPRPRLTLSRSSSRRIGHGVNDSRAAPANRAPTVVRSLSQKEVIMLIRAELRRTGISKKITRDEASAQAEACVSRALSIASKAVADTQLRLRDLSGRIERSTKTGMNEEELQRLRASQASLELRVSSSLSFGRWIWRGLRGVETFARYSAADEANPFDPEAVKLQRSGSSPKCSDTRRADEAVRAEPGGIWVPWDLEAANAFPDYLQWKPGGTAITASVPGLYLLSCGFFSRLPFIATVYLNGNPILSFSSPRGRTATSSAATRLDAIDDSAPTRDEAKSTTFESSEHHDQTSSQPSRRPSLNDVERFLCNIGRIPSSVKVATSPARTGIEPSTALHGDVATALVSYPEVSRGCPVESLELHKAALRNAVDKTLARKVVAHSIREYLAWPAGGVLSVEFAIPANGLKGEEVGDSGGDRTTTSTGQQSGISHIKTETAASVGSLRHSQGFLEFHKL